MILQKRRSTFHLGVEPRKNILTNLMRDAKRLGQKGETRQVLLCFTCDLYTLANEEYQVTGQSIQILHNNGLNVSILTKGGSRALVDLRLLGKDDSFGTTLTFFSPEKSRLWEPGAAEPIDRMRTLLAFHNAGIPTWVSLEPVIEPEQTLALIRMTHRFVDEYKVGKLNYHPLAKTIDWKKFKHDVVELLEELNCKYYLKADLRKVL